MARCVAYEAPGWGVGELWLDGETVVWHELPAPKGPVRAADQGKGSGGTGRFPRVPKAPVRAADQWRGSGGTGRFPCREPTTRGDAHLTERLCAYFAGDPVELGDVPVDLAEETDFGRALAAALRAVARGEVVTYGELAALAGRPGAARAAGSFCARNRLPLFVPCHRVVAAGDLGSYGSLGLEYKQRLLALEGSSAWR